MVNLKAPFSYFGGKSRIAPLVWERFGEVHNYVEPFFGSGAVLLARPGWDGTQLWIETVNDSDAMLCNFWRALQADPEGVGRYSDLPVHECDLHARHVWLRAKRGDLVERLEADPDYYDVKIAGWWVWGLCCWIGSGWCGPRGEGPWVVEDGRLVRETNYSGQGVSRKRPHLGNAGQGVSRQRPHLGNAGQGVKRQIPQGLGDWFEALALRLRRVRVVCGDWTRVLGKSVTWRGHGLTAIFMDPPYSHDTGRDTDLYTHEGSDISVEVRDWAASEGANPLLRIALCGYVGEHESLSDLGWSSLNWTGVQGFAAQNHKGNENHEREIIWFSPHCMKPSTERELDLLDLMAQSEKTGECDGGLES
jgi:DNA adenine methylase